MRAMLYGTDSNVRLTYNREESRRAQLFPSIKWPARARVILEPERRFPFMDKADASAVVHSAGDGLFIGITPSGPAQVLETDKERASAATPVELLLIALGSCTAVYGDSIFPQKRGGVTAYRAGG